MYLLFKVALGSAAWPCSVTGWTSIDSQLFSHAGNDDTGPSCKVIAVRTGSLSADTYLPQTCGLLPTPISFPTEVRGRSAFLQLWCGSITTPKMGEDGSITTPKTGGPGLRLP